MENLKEAVRLIGLAFQVRDDILDVTADFEELGKTPGKDVVAGKSTYPALLGLEKSSDRDSLCHNFFSLNNMLVISFIHPKVNFLTTLWLYYIPY